MTQSEGLEVQGLPNALSNLVNEFGAIDSQAIAFSFAVPTKEWIASLTQPTINFFLFDIRENTEKREVNPQAFRRMAEKEGGRKMPPRRMDLSYLVSVFASDARDELALLWRVTATLMRYSVLPEEVMPEELKENLRRMDVQITARLHEKESGRDLLEWWNALGVTPRASLYYVVTVPLDLESELNSKLVLSWQMRVGGIGAYASEQFEISERFGGRIYSQQREPQENITVCLETEVREKNRRRRTSMEEHRTDGDGRFDFRLWDNALKFTLTISRGGKLLKRFEHSGASPPDAWKEIILDN